MAFRDIFESAPLEPNKRDVFSGQVSADELSGYPSLYRLGFQSMEVQYLPPGTDADFFDEVTIGRVRVSQTRGPVRTQRTSLSQRPGLQLIFDKRMETRLEVGADLPLTVLQVEDTFSNDAVRDFARWREEALSAAGVLAAAFDERFVQREIFEDAVALEPDGSIYATIDGASRVRSFLPRFMLEEMEKELTQVGGIDLSADPTAAMAAKWFLRGVQAGPTTDAYVSLWIAMEALVAHRPEASVAKRVNAAITEGGQPLPEDELTVGRMARIRGQIVHEGAETPEHFRTAFYRIEGIARFLLRQRFLKERSYIARAWPATPGANVYPEPIKSDIDAAWEHPITNLE